MKKRLKQIILSTSIIIIVIFFYSNNASAYGCMNYGMAYEDLNGNCKCMSGYIMSTDFLGNPYCISGNSYCSDKYGYQSNYDYLSDSCECNRGYFFKTNTFGTECVSGNEICKDKFGFNSKYNSLNDKCECSYGYELSYKTYGNGYECKSCLIKYGMHSSYNSLLKECECDNGYTLKDGECVEKQNSAYFELKEVNTEDKEAIIKSDYTGNCYYISYGIGCYSSIIRRYIDDDIVINMGTDFYVDVWDWLILQENDQTCKLTQVEKVDCGFTLEKTDNSSTTYHYLQSNSCGVNSKLTIDNKCQCEPGYSWVDYNNSNNLDCEKTTINSVPQNITENLNDDIVNFIKKEEDKIEDVDIKLTNKLKGKILLQVEDKGQAWYVNPENGKRHYMANGDEAYNIMRNLGVGISNTDLEKIRKDKNFANKHSGKIFLQIEDLGQAFYIDFDGIAHYLKDGKEAYNIMRDLGLGITNKNLNKIDIEL